MEKTIKKELKTLILTFVLLFLFSFSIWILPNFGNLINPNGPFWNKTKGPHDYVEKEQFRDPNLKGNVVVYRDKYGVPHIYAEDYRDLFYVFGYLQAQDRFFEMTLLKLLGYGRLSEVAGSLTLDIDKYMRTISLWRAGEGMIAVAQKNKDKYNRAYTMILEYSKGVNKWVDQNRFNMPVEFSMLELPIEHWSMIDSAVMANLAGMMLSWITEDLTMEQLRLTVGPFLKQHQGKYGVSLDDLYPTWNMSYPYETPIIPDAHSMFTSSEDDSGSGDYGIYSPKLLRTISSLANLESKLMENVKDEFFRVFLEMFFQRFDWGIGSNNWVINGDISSTGKPILNGDPHLMLMAPSIWYEAHLVCADEEYEELEDPRDPENILKFKKEYNSYGVSFPGTPITLIGHNEHCAWSETNVGSDAFVDFYVETLNEKGDKYKYMGNWQDIEVVEKPILVKAGPITYYEPFSIRYTRHGPILSDMMIDLPYFGGDIPGDYEHVSVKYIGYNNSDLYNQLVAYDLLNRAENVYQMKTALDYYNNPPQNFVVADDSGNIGMISAGLFPLRARYSDTTNWKDGKWIVKANFDGRYIQPGDGTGQEWVGFVPPEHLPHCINPLNQDFLASANQRTIASSIYNYSIGDSWSPGWRARSINRYLDTTNPDSPYYNKKISVADMKDIQFSDYDIAAQDYVPVIINTYENQLQSLKDSYSSDFKKAIDFLKGWNENEHYKYRMNKYLISPTIFEGWYSKLSANLWGDEWRYAQASGESEIYPISGEYPFAQITEHWIMNKPENDPFFDDLDTPEVVETKTDLILGTLSEVVEELTESYGPIGENWKWGNHHQLALLGVPLILSVVGGEDPQSWPIHGSGRVLNNAPIVDIKINLGPINFDGSQYVFAGPSWRQVIDFSNIQESYGVLPGGSSGDPVNLHYLDQIDLFVEGNYKQLIFHDSKTDWLESEIISTQTWVKN